MRHAPAGCIVLLLFFSPACLAGDRYAVKRDHTDVRALPGDRPENYVTNRLRKGDVVEVVEEGKDGWLKIKPPPGSASWVNTRFLDEVSPDKPIRVVDWEEGTAVYPGPADDSDKRPNVIGVRLKRGHLVTRRGRMMAANDGSGHWMEIDSPESEARYVRADAVERTKQDVVPTSGTNAPGGPMAKATMPAANLVSPSEEMRKLAVAADDAGNVPEAVRLYDRLVAEFAASNPKLAADARARAAYLRDHAAAPGEDRTSRQTPAVSVGLNKGSHNPAAEWERRTAEATDPRNVRTYQGLLSNSYSQAIDGQRPYLLELRPSVGDVRMLYVVAASQGVDLRSLLGRHVELRGTLTYSGEKRTYVMQVTQARGD